MSWFEATDMTCPACGHTFVGGTAETINVTRMPWAREQILEGFFHRADCPACERRFRVERSFLFTDLSREQFVLVLTEDELGEWPALEALGQGTFEEAISTGPPFVRDFIHRYVVRTVFGLRQLREKLVVWDAGLDDALVELVKLDLWKHRPELQGWADLELTVEAVSDTDDRLELSAWSTRGSREPAFYAAPLGRYRELLEARAELIERFPTLFHRPFVSFRRLAVERVEGATPVGVMG